MKKSLMSKVALCSAGLAMVLGLAGCGSNSSQSKSGSDTAKSSQVTMSAADKAYNKANNLITAGSYNKAYNLLDNVDNANQKVEYLESDLESYIDASKDYKEGKYQEAESELPGMKSNSKPMKKAYKALRTKIAKAINGDIESGDTKSAQSSNGSSKGSSATKTNSQSNANSSSNATTTNGSANTSSQTPANAAAAKATNEDVISGFANKNGFNKKGYGIIPVQKNGNTYRFEVRQDNADNSVANMVGIYEYNSSTGSTTKVN